MRFGLTPEQLSFISTKIVQPIRSSGADVYVYGSRARGDHKPFSDLDLMIEGPSHDQLIHQLQEKLQTSNFPYKVDLVKFEEYADSYKPSYLKDRIRWPEL